MKEVEVKAIINDYEVVKKRLEDLGCEFSEIIKQEDKIFLHKEKDLSKTKEGNVTLRIRKTENKNILTMKKQMGNELDNIEKETEIEKPEEMAEIIKTLDFRETVRVSKERIKTKYNGTEICIDKVKDLGNFIEVEKMTEKDSETTQEELFKFLESLGVKKEEQVFKGYDTMRYEKLTTS